MLHLLITEAESHVKSLNIILKTHCLLYYSTNCLLSYLISYLLLLIINHILNKLLKIK